MNIKPLLARRTEGLRPSPIRRLNPLMRMPGMISLGGGYPNAETFALTSLEVVFKSGRKFMVRDKSMDLACQYGPTDAHADLKPRLIQWHASKDGVELKGEQIQVLNGAQEGLHTMAYLFLDDGDSVALSEPAYPGAMAAFRAFTERLLPVPLDAQGMITTELERLLAQRRTAGERLPKFIYDVPNGNNPAGVSLSPERRGHLLQLASKYDLLILEDDPYQLIQLEDRDLLPTLQSLDREGRVVRLDSFSKIFAPGLRLGYASGPAEFIRYLGILLIPGSAFSTAGGLKNRMRASFSMIAPEQTEEAMMRFARMIERERTRTAELP